MPQHDLEAQLRDVTQWDADRVKALASLKGLLAWKFAPQSRFELEVLKELERMKSLQFLSFEGSDLDRDNLRALTNCVSLRRLDLKGCRFKADDFAFVCEQWAQEASPKLTELWLDGASIGDESLIALGKIERLRWVILDNTPVSDDGVEHLLSLRRLETLWLQNTRISPEGALRLAPLSHLSIVVLGKGSEAEQLKDQLFRAQVALQKSKKPLDEAQVEAAQTRLQGFLTSMENWERTAYERAQDIEARHKNERPQSNVLGEAESIENQQFWAGINSEKAEIAERFCSAKLLERGARRADSYGSPPRFQAQETWIDVETPSKKKTIFYGEGQINFKRRYILILENNEWKLDEVQWWSGGWKRDIV